MTRLQRITRGLLIALFCGSLTSAGSTAFAARARTTGTRAGARNNAANNNNPQNNANSNSAQQSAYAAANSAAAAAAAQARRDSDAAQLALTQAQKALEAVYARQRKAFDDGESYQSAVAEMRAAQAEFEAARAPALASLRLAPEYLSAKAAREKAEAARRALPYDEDIKPAERIRIATDILDAATVLSNLELVAQAGDPAAMTAKGKLDAAVKKLALLQKQFRESLKDDPEVLAAQKDVTDKAQKLSESRTALAAVLR